MNKGCKGFIFLMTLCTILVISLLLLTCMQHVLLYGKAINRQELQHQNFYQLEALVNQLAQTKFYDMNKECIVHGKGANNVIGSLFNNKGCQLINGDSQYRYFIEDLGVFPCLIVVRDGQSYPTHHFRITVLHGADEHQPVTSIVQVRTIKESIAVRCEREEHRVAEGISSWRYFPDYQHQ